MRVRLLRWWRPPPPRVGPEGPCRAEGQGQDLPGHFPPSHGGLCVRYWRRWRWRRRGLRDLDGVVPQETDPVYTAAEVPGVVPTNAHPHHRALFQPDDLEGPSGPDLVDVPPSIGEGAEIDLEELGIARGHLPTERRKPLDVDVRWDGPQLPVDHDPLVSGDGLGGVGHLRDGGGGLMAWHKNPCGFLCRGRRAEAEADQHEQGDEDPLHHHPAARSDNADHAPDDEERNADDDQCPDEDKRPLEDLLQDAEEFHHCCCSFQRAFCEHPILSR